MKKVLVVSYSFPPVGGAGVQRPVKFVKYLRRYGWEPVVLTVANPSVPVFDHGLVREIPEGVAVYGARSLEPSYARKREFASSGGSLAGRVKGLVKKALTPLLLPDPQVLWWPGLLAELVRKVLGERPAALYVTAPPFSSFLPVVAVGKIFRLPVVLDYRDEWSFSRENLENAVNNPLAKLLDRLLEGCAVAGCAAFTAANRSYVEAIEGSFPRAGRGKGVVITNGYDPDDFPGARPAPKPEKITVVYTGTVWKATSLRPFAAALKALLAERPALAGTLSVKVFGRVVDAEESCLREGPLADLVELHGYIEHDLLMAETMGADILLLTLSDLPGAERIITGKAFEYMASGRQVLAVVPEGETRALLRENYRKLSLADPNDPTGIARALAALCDDIETIRQSPGNDVSHFSRARLTQTLASVLDRVAKP